MEESSDPCHPGSVGLREEDLKEIKVQNKGIWTEDQQEIIESKPIEDLSEIADITVSELEESFQFFGENDLIFGEWEGSTFTEFYEFLDAPNSKHRGSSS